MHRPGLGSLLLFGAAVAVARAASGPEASRPVLMPAFQVAATMNSIDARVVYEETNRGPRVHGMSVVAVRPGSAAARAGVVPGMEIVAIQGAPLHWLSDVELEQVMLTPVAGDVVLTVDRHDGRGPRQIRLPAPRPSALPPRGTPARPAPSHGA